MEERRKEEWLYTPPSTVFDTYNLMSRGKIQ
jgi:hypothetical protein